MAFDWTRSKERFNGWLNIQTSALGQVPNNSPGSTTVSATNTSVVLTDMNSMTGTISESVLGPQTSITTSLGGTANAYVLPWQAGKAAKSRLGGVHSIFITPNINGCGVSISGTAATPTIVHANCDSDLLNVPDSVGLDKLTEYQLKYRYPLWSDLYLTLFSKMADLNLIPGDNLVMIRPADYMTEENPGTGSIFGVKDSGNTWSFYLNLSQAKKTRKIWPE